MNSTAFASVRQGQEKGAENPVNRNEAGVPMRTGKMKKEGGGNENKNTVPPTGGTVFLLTAPGMATILFFLTTNYTGKAGNACAEQQHGGWLGNGGSIL